MTTRNRRPVARFCPTCGQALGADGYCEQCDQTGDVDQTLLMPATEKRAGNDKVATASLVTALISPFLCSMTPLFAAVAVILGAISLRKGRPEGRTFAWVGAVVGGMVLMWSLGTEGKKMYDEKQAQIQAEETRERNRIAEEESRKTREREEKERVEANRRLALIRKQDAINEPQADNAALPAVQPGYAEASESGESKTNAGSRMPIPDSLRRMSIATTPPGAAVTLDGRVLRSLTPVSFELSPGVHVVKVIKPNFRHETLLIGGDSPGVDRTLVLRPLEEVSADFHLRSDVISAGKAARGKTAIYSVWRSGYLEQDEGQLKFRAPSCDGEDDVSTEVTFGKSMGREVLAISTNRNADRDGECSRILVRFGRTQDPRYHAQLVRVLDVDPVPPAQLPGGVDYLSLDEAALEGKAALGKVVEVGLSRKIGTESPTMLEAYICDGIASGGPGADTINIRYTPDRMAEALGMPARGPSFSDIDTDDCAPVRFRLTRVRGLSSWEGQFLSLGKIRDP